MLQTLVSVWDPSLLDAKPPTSHKRDREGDIPDTRQGALAEAPEEPRVVAGTQRVSRAMSHVELIAAAQLLHEQSITPQLDIQHYQPPRQSYQSLYGLPLNISRQSQASLNLLNQRSSSTTDGIVRHGPNVSNQVDSWLPPANTGMNTDTSRQTTLFTYHQLELSTLTSETQAMAYNTPVSMGTAMNGMQVMDGSSAVQGSTANQAQPWHNLMPANSPASSIFQFHNWADQPGVPHFDHNHPQHQQLRQVQRGPSAGPPPLPSQQDHHQPRQHHPQQSQPTPTMYRRDAPLPTSPTFMEPLLNPQEQEPLQQPHPPQQQSAINHNTLQMWGNTLTASEYVSHFIQRSFRP